MDWPTIRQLFMDETCVLDSIDLIHSHGLFEFTLGPWENILDHETESKGGWSLRIGLWWMDFCVHIGLERMLVLWDSYLGC